MRKVDIVVSLIIGFLIGVFFFISLKMLRLVIPQSWLLLIACPGLALLGLFVASFLGRKFLVVYQMAKFLLVGVLNTFLDLGVLNLLMRVFGIYTGLFYSLFKALSFLAATVNSYLWNKHWTFEKREKVFAAREYLQFLIVATAGLLINVMIASLAVNVIGPQFGMTAEVWANIGAFAAVFIAWVWNFFGSKFIVFKK